MKPTVEIDEKSGFCFGVVTAIRKAEDELSSAGKLYCLGDIVHNSNEVERLERCGLVTINHSEMEELHNVKVLLRAHGEPPSTYAMAQRNSIEIIDATCPVVLRLQRRIKEAFDSPVNGCRKQIVIYGQRGHAEVLGLVGQTEGTAIVVETIDDLDRIDFTRDVYLYSQTTKSIEGFHSIIEAIEARLSSTAQLFSYDTICRQVAGRVDHLRDFAARHTVIIFVAGAKSSNGKILYNHCRQVNDRSYLVSDDLGVEAEWLIDARSIGICGATSTPRRLMEQVRERVFQLISTENNG
ncbi:MAG: 4-hydroxy-3-methylbut-2-enyl diphosphate reductase [Muribaculaceae bacterium]